MTASPPSTLSAAAIPASPSASPATSAEQRTRDISGRKCIASFEKSGRDGSFARTLLDTLNSVSTPHSLTWTLSTTPQRRLLFRLVPSGLLIGGTAYGLLPTPLASGKRVLHGSMKDSLLTNYLPRRFGGISHRMERSRAIGNAVVPLIPEQIGRVIIAYEAHLENGCRRAA